MERDFSDLDLDQLVSVFDNLGGYASDFKDAVRSEIIAKLFASDNPLECAPPPEDTKAQEWLKFNRIVERVKNHPLYLEALGRAAEETQNRITQPIPS
jgi:hypothetical protein